MLDVRDATNLTISVPPKQKNRAMRRALLFLAILALPGGSIILAGVLLGMWRKRKLAKKVKGS
jgi:hypothetical protein